MKPEVSERLFIEELFKKTLADKKINCSHLVNVDKLTGDASTRRYYRVYCKEQSYVVCLDHPSVEGKNSFIETQRFFDDQKVRVPQIYDYLPSKGYILEEDLGDTTLLKKLSFVRSVEEEMEIYQKALRELMAIHKATVGDDNKSAISSMQFDFEKLINEIDFTVDYFVDKFLGISDESIKRAIVEAFYPICKRLSSKSMVCTHRDFHSRNIMCVGEEMIIIDFQDARMGIPQYDLVSLLEDCYYQVNPKNVEILKRAYYDQMRVYCMADQNTYEEFLSLYDDMLLQRVFKAVGSFSYIFHQRKDVRYLKYIGFGMEKIKSVLMEKPELHQLKKELFSIYYES